MTLLEILVKELPSRGGWPEHSEFCWQDSDGEIRFDGDIDDDFYTEALSDDCVESGYHPLLDGAQKCVNKIDYLNNV